MRSSIEGLVFASPPPPPPPDTGSEAQSASVAVTLPADVSAAAAGVGAAEAAAPAAAAAAAAAVDPTVIPPTLRRPCCVVLAPATPGVVALRAEGCEFAFPPPAPEVKLLLLLLLLALKALVQPPGAVFVVKAFWDEEVSCECCVLES